MPDTMALITGASSGIGLELSRLVAADGFDVILVARNKQRLDEIAVELARRHGVGAHPIVCDLSTPGAAKALYDEVRVRGWAVDMLVNDAGVGACGELWVLHPATLDGIIQTNIAALTGLTRYFVAEMVERKRGRVLNVASTAALQSGPLMAVYYASKAYILSFTVALAEELRGTGVTATALCPGPTRTDFQIRAGLREARMAKTAIMMEATPVARAGYKAMLAGRPVCVPGAHNAVLAFLTRFSPRVLAAKAARRFHEPKS